MERLRASLLLVTISICTACRLHGSNVVTEWNTIASTTIVKNGGKGSTPSGVWFAYTSIAVYDAVNAITGQYRTFYYRGAGSPTASVDAAAVSAAHRILVNYFPSPSARLRLRPLLPFGPATASRPTCRMFREPDLVHGYQLHPDFFSRWRPGWARCARLQ